MRGNAFARRTCLGPRGGGPGEAAAPRPDIAAGARLLDGRGDGPRFIATADTYAKARVVLRRQIGQNQCIQFPIAEAYMEIEAANLMRYKAAAMFDEKKHCGAEANMAKHLCAKASWEAANACIQTFGGFGFAAEYDVERKFRETRLYLVAPISTNLILSYVAEHVLGMPRSF